MIDEKIQNRYNVTKFFKDTGGNMKISLSKEQLVEALRVAVTGISTNSTLPVMAGILIRAEE